MDTGLGRDGYSIIGQGKIDSIVAAWVPEDRWEIFEEAAGISRYRYRKEESERRLNKAEENLVRLRDILSELEGRVEPLRLQAEKAEQFIALDKEKKGLEIGIYWRDSWTAWQGIMRARGENLPGPGPARGAGGGDPVHCPAHRGKPPGGKPVHRGDGGGPRPGGCPG